MSSGENPEQLGFLKEKIEDAQSRIEELESFHDGSLDSALLEESLSCLSWYVENDETSETNDNSNDFWLNGKARAVELLERAKDAGFGQEVIAGEGTLGVLEMLEEDRQEEFAHEIWEASQLLPGETVEMAVIRIRDLLARG